MNDAQKKLHDLFEPYFHSSQFRDDAMRGIWYERQKYEEHLDKMWRNCIPGNMEQIAAYKRQVKYIKGAGLVVKRSKSTGKHKIVFPEK